MYIIHQKYYTKNNKFKTINNAPKKISFQKNTFNENWKKKLNTIQKSCYHCET